MAALGADGTNVAGLSSVPTLGQAYLFPPRGPGRPGLLQVQSEPTLRGLSGVREDQAQPSETFEDLLQALDEQRAARLKREKRAKLIERARAKKEREVERYARSQSWGAPELPPWNEPDPGGYFQPPTYETGEQGAFMKNTFLQGMYDVPGIKPPHSDVVTGPAWKYHRNNDKNEERGLFEKARSRMGRRELKYMDRLDKKMEAAQLLEQKDAEILYGAAKRKHMLATAPEFSSLKGVKDHWHAQRVTTHVTFSKPEPYDSGDNEYDTDLPQHIMQADRATSFAKDFICGDTNGGTKSFWRPPKAGNVAGTTHKHDHAQELLVPPGIRKIRIQEEKEMIKAEQREEARREAQRLAWLQHTTQARERRNSGATSVAPSRSGSKTLSGHQPGMSQTM
jgi:hypothetical protein